MDREPANQRALLVRCLVGLVGGLKGTATMYPQSASYIASLTVAQFKTFKKALRVLVNAGLAYDEAIEMLVKAGVHNTERFSTVKSVAIR